MQPDSFFENGAPLAFNDARYSGLSAGVPGTVRTWSKALIEHGTWSLRRALQAGVRVARAGFAVDDTFEAQIEGNVAYFDDVPSTAACSSTRTARRSTSAPRTVTRTSPAPTSASAATAPRASTRAHRPGDRRGRAAAADRGRRRPRLAALGCSPRATCAATAPACARPPSRASPAWTSSAWARRPAAARPSARS